MQCMLMHLLCWWSDHRKMLCRNSCRLRMAHDWHLRLHVCPEMLHGSVVRVWRLAVLHVRDSMVVR